MPFHGSRAFGPCVRCRTLDSPEHGTYAGCPTDLTNQSARSVTADPSFHGHPQTAKSGG